ncbi:hypothetical protein F5J12DRAFT_906172 [Pisolithus orientalis]|uniref:uncharacterized protein n=1 Tax=Pisolithus orientalis TaxID=936130 RepID=UPI002224ECB9|nr:uncharacterized protein F5J12DRAFT_906172 [Pisolithus orientalis]KAI6003527.1 hypothetical protein F5J12DRAFT_906172 [Pisolithus orientalis]
MHTPLIAWIADYPEQLLITCVSAKNSPISLAEAEQFRDVTAQPPHDHEYMLQKIQQAATTCDPCNIVAFHKACLALHINGVMEPFWKDWGDTCPSHFLTPNALHQWHKFYFDHCVCWVINIKGGEELNHHLAALQPRIGTRHWANGVSTLKQCTTGPLPNDVLCALHTTTKFIFLAQGISHYDETIHSLSKALFELTQHVAQSIHQMGAPYQWSSDITEHCHITHVKAPYHLSNR